MIRWTQDRKTVINLDGPDGNAFQFMSHETVANHMGYVSDEAIINGYEVW